MLPRIVRSLLRAWQGQVITVRAHVNSVLTFQVIGSKALLSPQVIDRATRKLEDADSADVQRLIPHRNR